MCGHGYFLGDLKDSANVACRISFFLEDGGPEHLLFRHIGLGRKKTEDKSALRCLPNQEATIHVSFPDEEKGYCGV